MAKKSSKKHTTAASNPKTEATDYGALSIGNNVMIRSAVYSWAGKVNRIVVVGGVSFVELVKSSWIADTGRYHQALKSPQEADCAEIDFVDRPVLVQISSIGDAVEIDKLPDDHV